MTTSAHDRVARTRSTLIGVLVVTVVLWTAVAICIALAADDFALRWLDWDPGTPVKATIVAALAIIVASLAALRARHVASPRRVALWIEERIPALDYALVTASDPSVVGNVSKLDLRIARFDIERALGAAFVKPVGIAAGVLIVAGGMLFVARVTTPARIALQAHHVLGGVGIHTVLPNRIASVQVRVTLPAYAGGSTTVIDDPSGVTSLIGSRVTVSGGGASDGITDSLRLEAVLGNAPLRVLRAGDDWHVSFATPMHAAALTLHDRRYERVLAIIPTVDAPPAIQLTVPARDTVWRAAPTGTMTLEAHATDDVGLAAGYFEYTVTSGSGEIFKARTVTISQTAFNNERSGTLRGTIPLGSLKLGPSDMLSVRAIVSDANNVTGPGISNSDTRTFRVARPDEFDSLAVEAAPPPPLEKALLTERMLIISAESLLKKKPVMEAGGYTGGSGHIGTDQASLRKRVYDVLYQKEEAGGAGGTEGDDEEVDPQLVLNRDLKQAYDEMWDAERSLNQAEIADALPHMRLALKALDRARLANRLYLRGAPPKAVVNVEQVRLTGKDKGGSNSGPPARERADTLTAYFVSMFDAAAALLPHDRGRAVDAMVRLRTEAADRTAFATAIGAAIDTVRKGHDGSQALSHARRLLVGEAAVGSASLPWAGAWSARK